MPRPIVIVDYDPRQPILYEEEINRILEVIEHKVVAIKHIGSTAVHGLGAKPVLDMMAGVNHTSDEDECVQLLQNLGYTDVMPQPGNLEWYYSLGKDYQGEPVRLENCHLNIVKFMSDY